MIYAIEHTGDELREALLAPLYAAGKSEAEVDAIRQRLIAGREDRARREAAFKPRHTTRVRKVMRSAHADKAGRLALLIRLRLLPNDPGMIAERAFPMSAPDRKRLVDELEASC